MKEVNSLGKLCPEPIIDLAKAVHQSQPGDLIRLMSDDLATWADLQAWGRMTSHSVRVLGEGEFEILV